MAYARRVSHKSIYKMQEYLDKLMANPDIIHEFPKEVYNSMQVALYCARFLKHPKYSKLRGLWTIKGGDMCYAVPKHLKIELPKQENVKLADVINPLFTKRDGKYGK